MTVIVKILGGMGNQMFQYAAAKTLAYELKTELLLDIESLHRHGERAFDLIHFNIKDKIAQKKDFQKLGWSLLSYPLVRLKYHPQYYLEKKFTYNSAFNLLKDAVYLDGYFQSEKYFENFKGEIRNIFNFTDAFNENEKNVVEKMKNVTAVSLHIRRGDYVTKASAQMENLSIDYYQEAMNLMENKIFNIQYFIFSDDIEWVKKKLKLNQPGFYVTGNASNEAFRDMRLMTLCRHHIIANSSFSWWGAWLNPNPDKIVLAPKIWFKDGTDDKDLIPANWIRV